MNRNIRFTRVWKLDGMPIGIPHDILRQRLHVKVEQTTHLNPGGLFGCRHQQALMGVLKLVLPGTVQCFANKRLDAGD